MARLPENLPTPALPLWDTFEVVFFLVAGVFLGVVAGVLFPSLWRTLRRRFRKPESRNYLDTSSLLLLNDRVIPTADLSVTLDSSPSTQILHFNTATHPNRNPPCRSLQLSSRLIQDPSQPSDQIESSELVAQDLQQSFFTARYLASENNTREAIRLYANLLSSSTISKHQTHSALFEMAQCYFSLGLFSKSLEIATELSARLRTNPQIFCLALQSAFQVNHWKSFQQLVNQYSGPRTQELRGFVSKKIVEFWSRPSNLSSRQSGDQLSALNRAVQWDDDNLQARVLLWQFTSQSTWDNSPGDPIVLSGLFFEDFFAFSSLQHDTNLSPYAVASSTSSRLLRLAEANPSKIQISRAKREFYRSNEKDLAELFESSEQSQLSFERFLESALASVPPVSAAKGSQALKSLVPNLLQDFPNTRMEFLLESLSNSLSPTLPLHLCHQCKGWFLSHAWTCPGCRGSGTLWLPSQQIFVEQSQSSL